MRTPGVANHALSAATAFVHEPVAFYVLRFLLGLAE